MWKQTERKTVVIGPRRHSLWWAGGLILAILVVLGLLAAAGWALLR
jgi:hypothetical protein